MKDRIEGFRKAFELPEHVIPLAFVPIGYPAQQPSPEERYREEKVYHNRYGQNKK
jgi:nitroreductase